MIASWPKAAYVLPGQVVKHQKLIPLGLILGTAAAEYVFAYHDVGYGIVLSLGLIIVAYIMAIVLPLSPAIARSTGALMLAPTYILFTASLPWFVVDQAYLLPGVYSIILGLVFWHLYRRGYSIGQLRDLGFVRHNLGRFVVMGLLLGIPTSVMEYAVLLPSPQLPGFSSGSLLRDAVYMFFFVALAEEVLFRGVIQKDLTEALGMWPGILLTGLLFGVMHMTWRSVPELGFTAMAGIMLGYVRWKTGSLVAPLAWHGINNTLLVGVLPYLLAAPATNLLVP